MKRLFVWIVIGITSACVDPLRFRAGEPDQLPVAVVGHISADDGPHRVLVFRSFDIESRTDSRKSVSGAQITLSNERNESVPLSEVKPGVYETVVGAMRGQVGGVYKIQVQLLNGAIYESIPDTLMEAGAIDSLYYSFSSLRDQTGSVSYGFDIKTNSSSASKGAYLKWDFFGTFKSTTKPELADPSKLKCNPWLEQGVFCNFLPPCTGLKNEAAPGGGTSFTRIAPCTCCTCWYPLINDRPILSDRLIREDGQFRGTFIHRVPLNPWIFMYKVRVEVVQSTLSKSAYEYFARLRDQREAVASLFQPVTGKMPVYFTQTGGEPVPVQGIFFAAGQASKVMYLTQNDVTDNGVVVPQVNFTLPGMGQFSCFELFPGATNTPPDQWVD